LAKVKKYGEPSADVVAMAEEARPKPVIVPVKKSSPQVSPRTIQTVIHMTTTPQKNKIMTIVKPIIKPGKKPIVIAEKPPAVIAEKPVVIAEKPSAVIIPKKKPVANRKPSVFSQIKSEPHKDVIIPTYMESTMEVVDVDDYEVEYVKLSVCEINGSTYFKSESQKIYKKLKDNKIGEYMGRYEANTSCIHTDIPDSDDEDES
jgi:hypothetical protein